MATLGEYNGSGSGTTKLLMHLNGSSADSSGNNNNGTDTGISYIASKFGNGANFDATTDKIALGNPASLQISGAQTVSFWLKAGSQGANNRNIIYKGGINGFGEICWGFFHYGGTQYLSYYIGNGTTGGGIEPTPTQTANDFLNSQWHNIILVFNPSTAQTLYLDGRKYMENTSSIISSLLTTKNLSIGKIDTDQTATARDSFIGDIDEVIIENVAWSADKVKKYYTFAKARFGII